MVYDAILLTPAYAETADGYPTLDIDASTQKNVFAEKRNVTRREHFDSAATGQKTTLMLRVSTVDYEDEPNLILNEKYYTIEHSYSEDGESVDLFCSDWSVQNGEAKL